ncbi:MAG: STAS domain-containing protein [Deltaproteobacteria bacterium]|nr:STAS domain-containing protein [Deltaproteobacteria bacterium]
MDTRWTAEGMPSFTEQEQAGLRDFYEVYTSSTDIITPPMMALIAHMPALAELMSKMSKAMLEEQQRRSDAQMKRAIVDGDWSDLITNQRAQGATYAGLNVPFRDWFDLVSSFQGALVPELVKRFGADQPRLERSIVAMSRYIDVVMSVIAEAYLYTKEQRIQQQQQAIQELSTPVLQVRDRLLLLPIIGVLDTHRARMLTEQLLRAIRSHRARVVVMDITGVAAVDSKVANHLLQTVEAARLMGARVVVTGLSPEVATTLVTLGVDLSRLDTVADLQGGLEDAERRLGLETVKARAVVDDGLGD